MHESKNKLNADANHGNVCDARAVGTSQRCGNPAAYSFFNPVDMGHAPEFLSRKDLAVRLLARCADNDIEEAEFLLRVINYRTLRKYMKAITSRTSPRDATLENAQILIQFDKSLQSLLLMGIGIIELQFRAELAYEMASYLGPFAHCTRDNFKSGDHYDSFLENYSRELEFKKESDKATREKVGEYGNLPIWEAVEIVSLGTLTKMYRNLKSKEIKHSVADSFGTVYSDLDSWMRTICEVRNRCAHFEDVCITPLKCRPKKIKGTGARNDSVFYVLLVLERLIEGSTEAITSPITESHYTSFATDIIDKLGSVPEIVLVAAGIPIGWHKALERSSNLIESVIRVDSDNCM